MRLGKIWISRGFLLLAVLSALWMEGALALGLLSACLLHEGAHLLVLRAFGGRLRALRLTLNGALLLTEQGTMGYGGELLAVMAGPGINLLLSLLLARAGERWHLCSGIHLTLGVFNLLPLPGLDGGRMLRLLFLLLTDREEK